MKFKFVLTLIVFTALSGCAANNAPSPTTAGLVSNNEMISMGGAPSAESNYREMDDITSVRFGSSAGPEAATALANKQCGRFKKTAKLSKTQCNDASCKVSTYDFACVAGG